jgi:hypothetical protein
MRLKILKFLKALLVLEILGNAMLFPWVQATPDCPVGLLTPSSGGGNGGCGSGDGGNPVITPLPVIPAPRPPNGATQPNNSVKKVNAR